MWQSNSTKAGKRRERSEQPEDLISVWIYSITISIYHLLILQAHLWWNGSLTRLLFYFLVGISSDPWTMVRVFDYSITHCKSLEVSTQTENQCVPACILSPDFVCLMFSSVSSTSLVLLSCILSSKVLKFTPNALFSIWIPIWVDGILLLLNDAEGTMSDFRQRFSTSQSPFDHTMRCSWLMARSH